MNDERGGRPFLVVPFPLKLSTWSRNDGIGSNAYRACGPTESAALPFRTTRSFVDT